jgi:hypothetical protein
MEDNNADNADNEFQEENETQEQSSIKKLSPTKKINVKYNSKSLKKSKLILNTESEFKADSMLNTNIIYKPKDLSYFNQIPIFFNKNFNLTLFKKQKEDSRSRSKSPERIRLPHQIRGNGIPNNYIDRLNLIKDFYKNEKFQKVYEKCPRRNDSTFEDLCDYIISYSKKNTILKAILLSYYFICHEIKYDYDFKEREEDYKTSQKAENVYENGLALSQGFTNIFEAILKKLDVRFRHIDGYCKFLPKDNNYSSELKKGNKNNTSTMYNSSISSSLFNSSKYVNTYDNETDSILDYINHCWNSFYYKGEWYLADTMLGSGSFEIEDIIKDSNLFKSRDPHENFNIFYILSWPNYLIYSHFPAEDNWQLTDKIWTFKQFLNKYNVDYPKFFRGVSKYGVELLSHNDPFIQINNKENLVIRLKATNYIIEGNLFSATNGQKINEVKYSFDQKEKIFSLEPTFPKYGDYLLRINLREISSTDLSYRHLFDYRVKVVNDLLFNHFEKYTMKLNSQRYEKEEILPKIGRNVKNLHNNTFFHRIITDYKKIFPSKTIKRICYDNEGFYLLEPRSLYLKKGVLTKFRVRIKGALHASLLDGNKWTNLKKVEDDVYEGQKIIETDNVSICCVRGKNVFTEVFKFKPRKNKYDLSHSQGVNHTVFKKF